MKTRSALVAFLAAASASSATAFTAPITRSVTFPAQKSTVLTPAFLAEKTGEEIAAEAVFVPPSEEDADSTEDEEDVLDTVEKFGKGAAKVRNQIGLLCNEKSFLQEYPLSIPEPATHSTFHS